MTNKLIRIIALSAMGLIGGVGSLLCLLIFFGGPDTAGLPEKEKFELQAASMSGYLDGILMIVQAAIFIALAIILIYYIIALIQNPKGQIGSLVGLVAVAAILAISWFLADDYINWGDLSVDQISKLNSDFSSGSRKFSGANVWAILIFLGLSVTSIIAMEAVRFFRSSK